MHKFIIEKKKYVHCNLHTLCDIRTCIHTQVSGFQCLHSGCMKTYAQKYQLKEHLKAAHDTDGDDCTRTFICPVIWGGKTLQNKSTIVPVTHATGILVRHCEYKSNRLTTVFITFTGSKTLKFSMLAEFHLYIYGGRGKKLRIPRMSKANRHTIHMAHVYT